MIELAQLARIIDIEYHDLLAGETRLYHDKIRAHLVDGSFVDIWFSRKITGRFPYHWERRHIDGSIYRHDNFPDEAYLKLIRPTKVRLQLKYVCERSFWTDLKIIFLTFQALLRPQSAAVRDLGTGDFHRKGAEHAKQ